MKIVSKNDAAITVWLSDQELYMLRMAFFSIDPQQDSLPETWTVEAFLAFEKRIDVENQRHQGTIGLRVIEMVFSIKELKYLHEIHRKNMDWLGEDDYKIALNIPFQDAEILSQSLLNALNV